MKLFRVHQKLVSAPIADPREAVFKELDACGLDIPAGDVALTAGSRGISNIADITRAVGDWLKGRGASPFIIPAMGSHNGATADGQRSMIESLGITEDAMGMEIRASMEVVKIGEVSSGDVFMDRHAYESEGAFILNRVKLHTCFSGSIASGLVKMMVVGMGKINSAMTFHSAATAQMSDMLIDMGRVLVDSGKIVGGLASLEDGFDQTAELHAVAPGDILEREPELLERHQHYFPRLPVDEFKVLVIDEIGKTYSGAGLDPNVIGRRGVPDCEDIPFPNVDIIAALRLTPRSQGNAIGVGLADFITQELRDDINEEKTFINAYTTGEMARAKIPATLADDEAVIERIAERYGDSRWMFIPNTLHLEELYVSEDLRDDVAANPICEVDDDPIELSFKDGRHELKFG